MITETLCYSQTTDQTRDMTSRNPVFTKRLPVFPKNGFNTSSNVHEEPLFYWLQKMYVESWLIYA